MAAVGDRAWILATAYGFVCVLTLLACRVSRRSDERAFWAGTTLLLIFLGLAKAGHLQGSITNWLRMAARGEGWYRSRAALQYLVLVLVIVAVVLFITKVRAWPHKLDSTIAAAGTAFVLLIGFIGIRAASIHEIDAAMTMSIGGLRLGWWLELAALVVVAISARLYARNARHRRT